MAKREITRDYCLMNEEMTKTEISSLVMSKLSDFVNDKRLEKRIKEITANIIDELFKTLWQKKTFWKNDVKR